MNQKDLQIEIIMGLPGSGKTTLADKLQKEKGNRAFVLHLDEILNGSDFLFVSHRQPKSLERIIHYGFGKVSHLTEYLIIEGLILTKEHLQTVLEAIFTDFKTRQKTIILHQFNEDRETCLKNDGGRRELPSANTIIHAQYDIIDKEEINKMFEGTDIQIKEIKKHKVFLKEDWFRYFKPRLYGMKDGYLLSAEWVTGGMSGNCWGDTMYPISSEEPREFQELDTFLEEVCPKLTFLEYKKVMRECVEISTREQSEYYGGCTNYAQWKCDLDRLYNLLKEFRYIKEETA